MSEIVQNQYSSWQAENSAKFIYNGHIYVGQVDTDPLVEANQVRVYYIDENEQEVNLTQPIRTNSSGFPVISETNSTVIQIRTDSDYSVKVLNKKGAQEWYIPRASSLSPVIAINHNDTLNRNAENAHNSSSINNGTKTVAESIGVPFDTYLLFRESIEDYEAVNLFNQVFERNTNNDGGNNPALISGKLNIFTSTGLAYEYIDKSWEIDARAIGCENVQTAINYMTSRAFGGRVLCYDSAIIESDLIDVKARVELVGAGSTEESANELKVTDTATKSGAHLFLKEYSKAKNIKICGSDYVKQSGESDYIGYNKIGCITQGASQSDLNAKLENVGFSQVLNSAVLCFDGHYNFEFSGCYTYGNMPGFYVETDSSGLVLDWNVAMDNAKLIAGTQVYALTNFYNSGVGTKKVTAFGNNIYNVNDSAFAVNSTSSQSHTFYSNTSIKDKDGYYGGFGLDFNGGSRNLAWGNTFIGHSIGGYYHAAAFKNTVFGNSFKCPIGVWFDSQAKSNHSFQNDIVLVSVGDDTKQPKTNPSCGIFTTESIRNRVDDNISQAVVDTSSTTKTITAAGSGSGGQVRLTIPSHGYRRRTIIEVTGVNSSANGIWQVNVIDENNVDLQKSIWSGNYAGGGEAYQGVFGIALGSSNSNLANSLITSSDIEDVAAAMVSTDNLVGGGALLGDGEVYINSPVIRRGPASFTNNSTEITGLSTSGVRARNRNGTVTAVGGTTTTQVTFIREEQDSSYRVVGLVSSPANNNPFVVSKSTTGFVIGHDNAGFDREIDWCIER